MFDDPDEIDTDHCGGPGGAALGMLMIGVVLLGYPWLKAAGRWLLHT